MKTKKILLPGMLATMMFAACTNEDVVSQQAAKAPEADLSNRPVVGMVDLGFGPQTRAEMGANFNDIEWVAGEDMIGARIIDNVTGAACDGGHAEHKYTITDDYAWTNYRYDYNGEKWTSGALMVEGNYMFYAPYDANARERGPLAVKFPTTQKAKGVKAIENWAQGGVGGNTSIIENFFGNSGDYTIAVGHTFISAKNGDAKVTPNMTQLYAYPLITLVNDYEKTVEVTTDGVTSEVKVPEAIIIDQITIESSNFYADYVVKHSGIADALKAGLDEVVSDKDEDEDGELDVLCEGAEAGRWIKKGLQTGTYLLDATSDVLFTDKHSEVKLGEASPHGKIVVDLGGEIEIPAGQAIKLNVIMPAAKYNNSDLKVNVRVVSKDDEGKTVYKKFSQNTFFFVGDKQNADALRYAVAKQIPYEEYNIDSKDAISAKKSWGTLAAFHLSGELVDVNKVIVDPMNIENNPMFYAWLTDVTDNSTDKFERAVEYDETTGAIVKEYFWNTASGSIDKTATAAGENLRKGDFGIKRVHEVILNAELVDSVYKYMHANESQLYFVSAMDVVGSDDAENPLVIDAKKFGSFGKLNVVSGHVKFVGSMSIAGLTVADGASVALNGAVSVAEISEIKGDVTLTGAALTAKDSGDLTFVGDATLTNVTIDASKVIFKGTATVTGGSMGNVEFNEFATLTGGTYGNATFKKGGKTSGTFSVDGKTATVTGGELEAAAGWATVKLEGGNMKLTNRNYAPAVTVGKVKTGNMAADANGKLTIAAELTLNDLTIETAKSKLVINSGKKLTFGESVTWTKGTIENSGTLVANLTVLSGNTYTHNDGAVLEGTLTNQGEVTNNGKLAVTNDGGTITVGTGEFVMTTLSGTSGTVNNTNEGYIKDNNWSNQVIYKKLTAVANADALKTNENAKINAFYLTGTWSYANGETELPAVDYYFNSGSKVKLGQGTINFRNVTNVYINSNQTWEGLDKEVSKITNFTPIYNSVTANEVTTYYTLDTKDIDMGNYLTDMLTGSSYVVLTEDLELTEAIKIENGNDVIINLNGKTISYTGETLIGVFEVSSGKLTINGTGTVNAGTSIPVWGGRGNHQGSGEIVINGGDFVNSGTDYSVVYADGQSKITINGGSFKMDKADENGKYWPLNNYNGNKAGGITVVQGKFYKFDPQTDDATENNFIAEGSTCSEEDADGWYTVIKN